MKLEFFDDTCSLCPFQHAYNNLVGAHNRGYDLRTCGFELLGWSDQSRVSGAFRVQFVRESSSGLPVRFIYWLNCTVTYELMKQMIFEIRDMDLSPETYLGYIFLHKIRFFRDMPREAEGFDG